MSKVIEGKARAFLKSYLEQQGRNVDKSDKKTFDVKIDGKYAEIKGKGKEFEKFDFFVFTSAQYDALKRNDDFDTFLVCNVNAENSIDIIQIPASVLRKYEPKTWVQYYWDKGVLNNMLRSEAGIRRTTYKPNG